MFTRKQDILIRLFTVGKVKTLTMKDVTYCKFSSVKRETKSKNSEECGDTNKMGPVAGKNITRLNYSDTSLSNIMLQVKSKKTRNKSDLIYFEGKRLLKDALDSGIKPLYVYFSRTDDISNLQFPESTMLFKVPYKDLKLWSDLTTCPGILAVCKKPGVVNDYQPLIPVSIICDNVREPGNLGSMIRSAAGAGVKNIILSEGCSDLWDSKVLRGAMGAHFRVPLLNSILWQDLHKYLNEETLFVIASNEKTNMPDVVPYYHVPYKDYKDITLVIGGETEGISSYSYSLSKLFNYQKITIPLSNAIESINNVSALSVILYEIKRQFQNSSVEET